MMRQGKADAVAERADRQAILCLENDGTLALVDEGVGIDRAERLDQAALAMEVDCIAVVTALQPIDADRRAAAALGREIARLAPFQRLPERAHAGCPGRGVEH